MSIAVQKIKRAIADMPTGGMQTGRQRIKLDYSDAQRAIAEIEGLTAERDALQARVELLRDALSEAQQTIGFLSHHLRGRMAEAAIIDMAEKADSWAVILNQSPTACLAQVRAEAGRAGFVSGYSKGWNDYAGVYGFRREPLADQYAERIRQGGAK
jgi:hypothetical protein